MTSLVSLRAPESLAGLDALWIIKKFPHSSSYHFSYLLFSFYWNWFTLFRSYKPIQYFTKVLPSISPVGDHRALSIRDPVVKKRANSVYCQCGRGSTAVICTPKVFDFLPDLRPGTVIPPTQHTPSSSMSTSGVSPTETSAKPGFFLRGPNRRHISIIVFQRPASYVHSVEIT